MTNKSFSILPVFAAILLIPQLLFWWLAPLAAQARIAVYLGGTFITFAAIAALFAACWKCGLRKSVALAVVTCVLFTATVALCTVLLAMDVTVRSAVFALVIAALVHLMALTPMVCSAFKPERAAITAINGATAFGGTDFPDGTEASSAPRSAVSEDRVPPALPVRRSPAGKPNGVNAAKALPPRNG